MIRQILPAVGLVLASISQAAEPVARGSAPVSRAKADVFVPGVSPASAPVLQSARDSDGKTAWQPPAFPNEVDLIFYARTRPVRVNLTIDRAGTPVAERWEKHLKKLFTAFDRDGDGVINRYEVEHIFPSGAFLQLLQGGSYYRNPSAPLIVSEVDRNGDGRVTFAEFGNYYNTAIAKMLRIQPIPTVNQTQDTITKSLFAKFDTDNSKTLSKTETAAVESLLTKLDVDEDECVSLQELLGTMNGMYAAVPVSTVRPAVPTTALTPQPLAVFAGGIPGTVVQELIKRYDRNDDFQLTREESGFDVPTFSRLDCNQDGQLSATELDQWRLGESDVRVKLMLADTPSESEVRVSSRLQSELPSGLEIRQTESNRLAIRLGTQTFDIGASVPNARFNVGRQNLAAIFPQGKDVVSEADLVGPQFQYLRILFDSADFNMDAKLTRKELEKYFELQESTSQLGVTLVHKTRTPNLFQLLDENGDGRLSVRELRTSWNRLIVLEPGEAKEVTETVLQPAAFVRVGTGRNAMSDPAIYGAANAYSMYGAPVARPPAQGPTWFRKMDRNQDGDVSRTEFLGSPEDFQKIDSDGDGLISLKEAETFDKSVRK